MAKTLRAFISPRGPMVAKIARWCVANGVIDTGLYEFYDNSCYRIDSSGKAEYGHDYFLERLDAEAREWHREVANHIDCPLSQIGMTTEGWLNQSLLGHVDERLAMRFRKFLAKYGYVCRTLANCYYIIYRLPHEYDTEDGNAYNRLPGEK